VLRDPGGSLIDRVRHRPAPSTAVVVCHVLRMYQAARAAELDAQVFG
jgi:hypothetical protein